MKILIVLEHFHPYIGGVEFLFWQLSNSLVAEGNSVKVITTRYDKSLPKREVIDNIEVIRVSSFNRFLFSIWSIPVVISHARNCDIIQTTTYNAAIPSWVASKVLRKKCVITFHEFWGELWKSLPFLSGIQRFFFRFFEKTVSLLSFTRVVAISDATKSSLIKAGIEPTKIVKIYNGLDYPKIAQIQKDLSPNIKGPKSKSFLFVARLGVSKGYDLLLPASEKVLQNHPEYQLTMVIPKRPYPMYKKIMSMIRNLNTRDQIRIVHNLSKEALYEEYQKAKFVVIPSYTEGFCFVAAEAVALDRPVVSSGLTALAEVVGGKYIEMQSQTTEGLENALEDAIAQRWKEKEKRIFSLQDSVDNYTKLYKELAND